MWIRKARFFNLVFTTLGMFFLGLAYSPAFATVEYRSKESIEKMIHKGDSAQRILSLLGAASHDDVITKKENDDILGRRMMYIYHQRDKQNFNPKTDNYLRLWFDTNGYLEEIDYH